MGRSMSVRWHLIRLAIMGVLPMVLLAGWLLFWLDRGYREANREHVLRTARALSEAVDNEVEAAIASLETLASSPLLDTGDFRGFHDRTRAVLETRRWTTAVLLDASGQKLSDAALPFGAPLSPAEDREVFEGILRTGRPAVSGLVVGRGDARPALDVWVPVLRDGAVRYVLIAGIDPAAIRKVLTTQKIPADWRLGVNDRHQAIVTSTLDPDPFVGQRVTSRMATESVRADEGWFPNTDKEGRRIYAAFHRSPMSGLVLVMNVPATAVDGPANHSMLIVGGGGVLLLVGSLAAALAFGRRLSAAVIAFRDAAIALGRGEPLPAQRAVAVGELREASTALDAAAALLAARETERTRLLSREQGARAEAERVARMLQQVQLVTETTLRDVSPNRLMRDLLARVREALASDTATILLSTEDGAHLTPVSSDGLREDVAEDVRIPFGRAAAGLIAVSEAGLIFPDLTDVEVLSPFLRERVKSLVGVPLRVGDRVIGVLHVGSSTLRRFTEDDLALLRLVADRVALVIERTRLHEAERAARQAAEAANRVKDEFLAMLSHELRSPLNAIAGWVNILDTRRGDADGGRAAEVIGRNTRLLTKLVDDLLDVSRIVAGRLHIEPQRVGVVPVVRAVLETMRPAALEKHVALESFVDGSSGTVWGDPARLHQVVSNLVGNAIKFTPAGGVVEVRVRAGETHIQVTVSDTGQGIAPEFLPHVFDRFRQEDTSAARTHGGLGLGLAIVRHLAESHGGTVHAESAGHGQGTRFTVSLPLLKDTDHARPTQ